MGYATKELARTMASPTLQDEVRMKRLVRYLVRRPRGVYRFPWQQQLELVRCFGLGLGRLHQDAALYFRRCCHAR